MSVYVNANGYDIVLHVGQDISAATVMRIYYKKPSGATGYWTATARQFCEIGYVVQTGNLNEAGTWELQSYVTTPAWGPLYGDIVELEVATPLA
jgi:hypothetical protein